MPKDMELMEKNFDAQKTPGDKLYWAYLYYANLEMAYRGDTYEESKRVGYGFNEDGEATEEEFDYQGQLIIDAVRTEYKGNPLDNLKAHYQAMAEIQLRNRVLAGQEYQRVYDALEGEAHQKAKADYLYQASGMNYRFEAGAKFQSEAEGRFADRVKAELAGLIGDDKTMTYDQLLGKLGYSEEQRRRIFADSPKLKPDKTIFKDISDTMQSNGENPTDEQVFEMASDQLSRFMTAVWQDEYRREAIDALPEEEKRLYDQVHGFFSTESRIDDTAIEEWITDQGREMALDLEYVNNIAQKQRTDRLLEAPGKLDFGKKGSSSDVHAAVNQPKADYFTAII